MGLLDKTSRDVLRVVYSRGIVRGRDVKRFARLADNKALKQALDTLTKAKFVTLQTGVSGVESEQAALESYISPLASRKAEAEYELAQPDT